MKVNRSVNSYHSIPDELCEARETKEVKATLSINMVVPKSFEKFAQKFMANQADEFNKALKKAVKKEVNKKLDSD